MITPDIAHFCFFSAIMPVSIQDRPFAASLPPCILHLIYLQHATCHNAHCFFLKKAFLGTFNYFQQA